MKEIDLERQYEKLLNIRTTGRDDSNSDNYKYPYEPTPYCVLERLANSGYVGKKNILIDYGCGKGRVEFYLSYQTRCRSIGIEYDERIYAAAMENKKNAASANRVEFLHVEATAYTIPSEVDRVFFFNPFSVDILQSVVSKLISSYYENPREIIMFFYFPSDEYVSYLMTQDEVNFVDEIECDDLFSDNKDRERILIFSIA